MKTNIYKYICLFLLASSLAGCSEDFLEAKDLNNQTEETFWNSEEDAYKAMATLYSPIRAQMYGYYAAFTGFQNMNIRADDVHAIQDDPESWKITIFENTTQTDRYDWTRLYLAIGRANVFLANVDKVPDMTDEMKKEYKAEAHFIRGLNYFLFATNYGRVPLKLDPTVLPEDTQAPLATEEQIWQQVESDLKAAKEYLPISRDGNGRNLKGRAARGAAIAYLAKAYAEQHKYDLAKTELEIIMKAPYTYDLVESYEENFTPVNEFNEESIFELDYAKYGSGSWGDEGANDTQGMVLPNFIGAPISGGWFKLMPSGQIIEKYIEEERPTGSDSRFDKRMYTNFYFKYSDYADSRPDESWYGGRYSMDILWEDTEGKRAKENIVFPVINGKEGRFLPKKFAAFWLDKDKGDSMYDSEPIDNNFRVMRFAEILLLHAEACAKTGNDLDAARNDLKRIRNRAGLADTKTWASADDIMKEIEHQNLLEFWFEGHRFFDLKRWYSHSEMKNIFVANKKQGAANFEAKHFVYPIPQSELDLNKLVEQNPLWK